VSSVRLDSASLLDGGRGLAADRNLEVASDLDIATPRDDEKVVFSDVGRALAADLRDGVASDALGALARDRRRAVSTNVRTSPPPPCRGNAQTEQCDNYSISFVNHRSVPPAYHESRQVRRAR
jgi:hypothetical protein